MREAEEALTALKRAALSARETAIRTNTNLVIMKEGKLVQISPNAVKWERRMTKIYKYPFDINSNTLYLMLPEGARILYMGLDPKETPCAWALVNPEAPLVEQQFKIYGTGQPVDSDPDDYRWTFLQGPFVWHVFIKR